MEFTHKLEDKHDCIAAIATPAGEGAIAIIRLTGHEALQIASKLTSKALLNYKSHTAHFCKIKDKADHVIDSALLLVMLAPNTYTGEDIVEIQCHGGKVIARRVLESALAAGARAAKAGEFTFRAFLNGKLDLVQAEAVQQLISAKSHRAATFAERQLEGRLSAQILAFEKELIEIAAILEAWVDFPEEDLECEPLNKVISNIEKISEKIAYLSRTFHQGKLLFEGGSICICGAPNVGKSSLMNALCRKDRSIVTPIAGTTRDFIEEIIELGENHFRLIDTAGIRESEDPIEKEGVLRSKKAIQEADLLLLMLDASRTISDEEIALLNELKAAQKEVIVVFNKIDLAKATSFKFEGIKISAKNGENLDTLIKAIESKLQGSLSSDELIITKLRHQEALDNAYQFLQKVIIGLKENVSPEFAVLDLRSALKELGSIIGLNITEEILSAIFSKFCIGK